MADSRPIVPKLVNYVLVLLLSLIQEAHGARGGEWASTVLCVGGVPDNGGAGGMVGPA